MHCAFCDGSMVERPIVDGMEGQTGGLWWKAEFECASCGGIVVHDVMEKIGSLRETWRVDRLPSPATALTELHCPACDALLVSAWPADARPASVTSFDAARAATSERRTDHVCTGCNARYVLQERVETTWQKAEDGSAVLSPRPYPRSR